MSSRFIAVVVAAMLAAAGVKAFSNGQPAMAQVEAQKPAGSVANQATAQSAATDEAYVADYKTGYSDGFNLGVAGLGYPDQSSIANDSRGYLDGLGEGYTDGQNQQESLQSQLCGSSGAGVASSTRTTYAPATRFASGRTPAARIVRDEAYNRPERVDRGIGQRTRQVLLIAGGAAAGAGVGGAVGGKKGAAIGALVGGGTGTALALTKKPRRAFNDRVSGKSMLTKTLIGAGAGAAIGALAGGKRGALSGAALGGGGGALWSLMSGERPRRR
ncbi:MAG TPA: hypothetical protein VJH03_19975 [Blastocatellia bacterium]|nr:hypothetical protein [Blastocatellia bacterium]